MFFSKSKFLGIDIGNFSIKVVQLSKKRNGVTLDNYGEVATKEHLSIFSRESKGVKLARAEEHTAELVKSVLKETGMNAKESYFSVPNFASFFTNFDLPPMKEEEVEGSIKYQAKKHIPVPLSEVALDWSINEKKNKEKSVSLIAVPNDIIRQYQNIATFCGLELNALEMEAFSLGRLANKKGLYVILNIGFSMSSINIVDDGVIKTAQTSNFSGSKIKNSLAQGLDLIYNERKVNEIKEKEGMQGRNQEIIAPLVDEFLEEIERSLHAYLEKEKEEVTKVLFCGGGSLLLGLKEYIGEKWNKPTEQVSLQMLKNASKIDTNEISSIFSAAIGAAFYGVRKN